MMKKIYKKPNLAIESLATEEVMAGENALVSQAVTLNGQTWNFLTVDGTNGTANMLNSIDYEKFNQ